MYTYLYTCIYIYINSMSRCVVVRFSMMQCGLFVSRDSHVFAAVCCFVSQSVTAWPFLSAMW